jgi:predicted transcriptional regulator of viral defense system
MCNILGLDEGNTHMYQKPDYDSLYQVAENQAGYFTASQARDVGFSWERLSSNTKKGLFLRAARGVYRLVRFPGSAYEDLFVAWLRTGRKAVISHESALSVYDLSDVLPGEIHVIEPETASRRRKGIRQHTNKLSPNEITHREGLPVTTVVRTIADVSISGLAEEQVKQAIQESLQRGLTSKNDLLLQADRRGGRAKRIIQATLLEVNA